jgi:anti-anti-sigma factor
MQPGRILVANHDGAHLIKFVGDVRVTLCADFDDYLAQLFAASDFVSVIIDLTQAEGIDSTSLGMLAKIAIEARKRYHLKPVILSTNSGITRLIQSMGFDTYFDIRDEVPASDSELAEIPHVDCSDKEMRGKVLTAHRVLMGLSDTNKARFSELITALENAS